MDERFERLAVFVRGNVVALLAGVLLLSGVVAAIRWIAANRGSPAPRKVMQFTAVTLQPPPKPPPPPPPPVTPPKVEEPESTRVNLRQQDLLQPDEPRPASPAGPLALAAEGEGPGDAFNLAGNPGGRGLLGGGGDGSGGLGGEGGNPFGWYYAQVADELTEQFRRNRRISVASTRAELRLWVDPSGRVSRIQLVRSTGDPEVDQAIESAVGMRLRQPPPPGSPMPMVLRLTARRPQ